MILGPTWSGEWMRNAFAIYELLRLPILCLLLRLPMLCSFNFYLCVVS
jgi:hypothetical protein